MEARSHPDPETTVATAGEGDGAWVDVGVLVAHSPTADDERLRSFAARMAQDGADELGEATDVPWYFHAEEPARLSDGGARRPSEFLGHATHRMVERPYDVVLVVTDVPLLSRREHHVPGLASPVGRVVVVSTRGLVDRARGEPARSIDSPAVRWNAATLALHLVGHVLGARHREDGGVMEPFAFDPEREGVPPFEAEVESYLRRIATEVPEEEAHSGSVPGRIGFHAASAVRHPGEILRAVVDSRAPLLPLSLPKLSTAALTPTLVIVFSAEAWDVGFHLDNLTAGAFALGSVVAAAAYLQFVQNLTFPRKQYRGVTEHTALVNVTIFCILLLAMAGLFATVGTVMLLIELVVFPPNLMANWPSLDDPTVGLADLVRTGAFISTVGVLSGTLAGGLESRTILGHMTLFLDRP